jgi:hypothetical protein
MLRGPMPQSLGGTFSPRELPSMSWKARQRGILDKDGKKI